MAKPNLALIPATIGDKVYSILPSDGVGDFDFTRASTATRINAQGLIEEVASGENRLNYSLLDGEVVGCPHLLLEPQSTNLFTYSEAINQSSWAKSNASIIEDTAISPNGTQSAETFSITSNFGYFYKGVGLASGTTITQSIFVKNIDADRINLQVRTASTAGLASFFFTNSEITSVTLTNGISADFDNYGNGWYRVYLTCTTTETNQLFRFQLNQSGMSCYVWGAMVEQNSYPTSYIKTTSAAVTRAAETCNGSGDAATFNDSEGVLMAEIAFPNPTTSSNLRLAISDGTAANRILIQNVSSTSNRLQFYLIANGGISTDFFANLSDITSFNKIVFKYKTNDFSVWINGFEVLTDTSGSTFSDGTLNELAFDGGDGTRNFYGKTKQLQYFDSVLDSEQLEELTSWDSFRDMAQAQLYSVE